ncbi:RING-H2 finger protein ATL78-like [Prosopis cineraria]|uniref:RING-H2 finger protein ATL78-like n=1 Tax=Prosopis cineraria TaxID=364024 RepID=UPI00240F36F2|nr:RING-H2 finger protein ATL78-like [Prosopis cineraria]
MADSPSPSPSPSTLHHPSGLSLTVLVAAVVCAFLCALGLNTMLHCVFQCAVTEPLQWIASRRINSGLKKKDMISAMEIELGFSQTAVTHSMWLVLISGCSLIHLARLAAIFSSPPQIHSTPCTLLYSRYVCACVSMLRKI